jgi:proteasome lid subunit RPN8/RPN11
MMSSERNIIACEVAYILIGETTGGVWHARMQWRSTGRPASVEFDWQRVMQREEWRGDVVGYFHTHPHGFTSPSSRDDKTMYTWSTCFGKRLLCLIDDGDGTKGWVYDSASEGRTEVSQARRFRNDWIVVIE